MTLLSATLLSAWSAPRAPAAAHLYAARCSNPSASASATSERLYSLIHLGGFAGDLSFYCDSCSEAARVLELGCGDGRLAAALCQGELNLSVFQEALSEADEEEAGGTPDEVPPFAGRAVPVEYVGVEIRESFVRKARERLTGTDARIVHADFFEDLPADMAPFSAVVLSANTLFCSPKHAELLRVCRGALAPGGLLLLDVYNANPWHQEAESAADDVAGGLLPSRTGGRPWPGRRYVVVVTWLMHVPSCTE